MARVTDARDARRDVLWRELSPNLLPRRSAVSCQPHGADPHLRPGSDADRAQPWWNPDDDHRRDVSEFDQGQTQGAGQFGHPNSLKTRTFSDKIAMSRFLDFCTQTKAARSVQGQKRRCRIVRRLSGLPLRADAAATTSRGS